MPRKQRFKPSRKPKPVDSELTSTTAKEQAPALPSTPAVITSDRTPPREDVSGET